MAIRDNPFSWSMSRSTRLAECPRAYYYQYYLAHGGWDPSAPPEVKEADLLKRLKSRWMWAGIAVHDTIAEVIQAIQKGGWIPSEEAEKRLTERMRADYRASNNRRYLTDRKAAALVEHEYKEGIADTTWQALYQQSMQNLRNFYAMDVVGKLRALASQQWLSVETMDTFDFDGTPVHVVLDLAYRTADDEVVILDWKTGKTKSDDYQIQLFCYGYYARSRWASGNEPIHLEIAYLYHREVERVGFADAQSVEGEEYIRSSILEMKRRLVDPSVNVAREEDFEPLPEARRCGGCNFRRICERKGILKNLPPAQPYGRSSWSGSRAAAAPPAPRG